MKKDLWQLFTEMELDTFNEDTSEIIKTDP